MVKVGISQNFACVRIMVFNATFNNISAISWRQVLLVEETGVPGENHQPALNHWQTLSHNVVSSTPRRRKMSHLYTCNVTIIQAAKNMMKMDNSSMPECQFICNIEIIIESIST